MAQKVKVFISSSTDEKDIAVVGKLDKFLGGLKNSGIIEVRTSQEITAGSDLEKETKRELQNADLILLIISIDYITSSKIWKKELEIAMGRHERMEARVIPIFARSTPLLDILQFSKLKDLPGDKKTISDFANEDKVYTDIVTKIEAVAVEVLGEKEKKAMIFSNEEQGDKPKIFLSVGTTDIMIQIEYTKMLKEKFLKEGFQLTTLEEWDNEDPFRVINELMDRCVGCTVLLLERYYIEEGKAKRGGSKETQLPKGSAIPTPWNHIEASLANSKKLPLLILRDKNIINDGVFTDSIKKFKQVKIDTENFHEWEQEDKAYIFDQFIEKVKSRIERDN